MQVIKAYFRLRKRNNLLKNLIKVQAEYLTIGDKVQDQESYVYYKDVLLTIQVEINCIERQLLELDLQAS